MKKRLLITSIVMMLVVAVALSTATYAWFTSNATVTASSITLTASGSDGLALGIAWLGGQPTTTITATGPAAGLKPMVPATLAANTTTTAVTWSGASTYNDGGTIKFNAPYDPAPVPYTYQNSSNVTVIDLSNQSSANDIAHVTLTPTIAAHTENKDASSLVRIAVFKSTTSNGTFTLLGVLGSAANLPTEWGTVTTGGSVAALCADNAEIPTTTTIDVGAIEHNANIYLTLIMWLDGAALGDGQATYDADISLSFTASGN